MSDRTAGAYAEAFGKEAEQTYPAVNAFEAEMGYAVDRDALLAAARVLACPLKKNAPNWQHGRVLYAVARRYLAVTPGPQRWLDIGTAKGFSACVMAWALSDAGRDGHIDSLDVVDPDARIARNSVAELDGFYTVPEFVAPFMPVAADVAFHQASGGDFLALLPEDARINLAFVDGRHDFQHVFREGSLLAAHQQPGDIVMFDDLQYPQVAKAVRRLINYDVTYVTAKTGRVYALAVRK